MDFKVYVLTQKAAKDLDDILDYVSNQLSNPVAAKNIFIKINKAIDQIRLFPESCPILSNEFIDKEEIRKAIISGYVMYYIYDNKKDIIIILRIVYGRRNLIDYY